MSMQIDCALDLLKRYDAGRLDRRSVLKSLGLLGISSTPGNAVISTSGSAAEAFTTITGPEERAWGLAKEAAAKATRKTLTILIPTGSAT